MSFAVVGIFCLCLIVCVALGVYILYPMLAGVLIFSAYALIKGFKIKQVFGMILSGIKTAKNVLIALVIVGMMTALWRSSGTIPAIVSYASTLIHPDIFILAAFLLNCLVGFLMGTSLGTSATMGVICVTVGKTMGIDSVLVGGAVLSGAYFGDRCSPVSTSALLVSTLTKTNLYDNIKTMFKTAAVPFAVTCVMYLALGFGVAKTGAEQSIDGLFSKDFVIHPVVLIPAALIILLALFRVDVKISMGVSTLSAFLISVFVQHRGFAELLKTMITGFKCENEKIASMTDGGGVISMLKVIAIICCALAFSGIFDKTGITASFKTPIKKISEKISPYGAVLVASCVTSAIGSNQTIALILTNTLCEDVMPDNGRRAICLEDTVIVIAALVPWSTAGGAALSAASAPEKSILFAFYLMVLPLINFAFDFIKRKTTKKKNHITA